MDGRTRQTNGNEAETEALFAQIGRQKVELDWLKKKLACPIEELRLLVERDHPEITMRRQCELLGVNRAGLHYQEAGESEENLRLMRLLDEQYTRTPFYGSRKMVEWLRTKGFEVKTRNECRV